MKIKKALLDILIYMGADQEKWKDNAALLRFVRDSGSEKEPRYLALEAAVRELLTDAENSGEYKQFYLIAGHKVRNLIKACKELSE